MESQFHDLDEYLSRLSPEEVAEFWKAEEHLCETEVSLALDDYESSWRFDRQRAKQDD